MSDIEETMPEQKEEKKCEVCEAEQMMVATAIRHTACSVLRTPEDRERCMEWAAETNPEDYKDALQMMNETMEKVGVEGIDKHATVYNEMVRKTIVDTVGKKLQRKMKGEDIERPQIELELFKKYSTQGGI
jgi:hypothetical protein